jgi:hypothetical protein
LLATAITEGNRVHLGVTLWESRIEGDNDYFLPGGSVNGGIYEIRRGVGGSLEGLAGSFVKECGWVDDYETTFGF